MNWYFHMCLPQRAPLEHHFVDFPCFMNLIIAMQTRAWHHYGSKTATGDHACPNNCCDLFCQSSTGPPLPTAKLISAIKATEPETRDFVLLSCLFHSSAEIVKNPNGSIAVLTEGVSKLQIFNEEGTVTHDYVLVSGEKSSFTFRKNETELLLKREWSFQRVWESQEESQEEDMDTIVEE